MPLLAHAQKPLVGRRRSQSCDGNRVQSARGEHLGGDRRRTRSDRNRSGRHRFSDNSD